tara:strand:- start:35283 stop:35582 length:300 start_codon:yes stop_codon:yes gene_type:complete
MSWEDILKEETNAQKTYKKVLSDYSDWLDDMYSLSSEQGLGVNYWMYFDGAYPDLIENVEQLKKEINDDIRNFRNDRHIDVSPLKQMLFALEFSKEMMK